MGQKHCKGLSLLLVLVMVLGIFAFITPFCDAAMFINGKQAADSDIAQISESLPADIRESLAEWISPTVSDIIKATGGEYQDQSVLRIIGTSSTVLNWANSAINRAGGFDGKANMAYWLFTTSSIDYKNIQISGRIRSSATGPRDFKLQYSCDGSNWNDALDPAITVGNALTIGDNASQFTKTLPLDAMDSPILYIRLLQASNTSANGGIVASGGTNSINNIIVSGEYDVLPNKLFAPQTDTPSGAFPLGQLINFTPVQRDEDVSGYGIMVSTDDGATWNILADNQYTLDTLPLTLQVKAIAPAMIDSRVTIYNYTQDKLPMVTASKNSGALIAGATVALSCSASDAQIRYRINSGTAQLYSEALVLEENLFIGYPGTLAIEAWAESAGYISGDPTTFYYTKAVTGGEKVYFGQLHSHTTNSDGIGSLTEAFDYAKNIAKLDFFAVTDHSNSFDETGASSDNPATINLDTYNSGSSKWQAGVAAAAAAYLPNAFISFYGYEMTWSGGPGHMNTFNSGGFVSRNNTTLNSKTNDAGLRAYYELLTRRPQSISMFNHPGTTFGNFANFSYYDTVIDQRISLIEVGNGEGMIGSGGYWRSYEQYTLALDKGWHVAPANNQDNHLGKWGDSNTARTAIWTNDLSLEGVYQALRDMRVYATEVADLEIVYKVNGQPLGSIIDVVPPYANFSAEIVNPTAGNSLKSVSLITNGGTEIQKVTPATRNYNYDVTIAEPRAGYYYLKVVVETQQGERLAVTAPVWLGQGKAAGFVEVSKSSNMPVTTENLTLTSTLFNNESRAATLLSLTYTEQNGSTLGIYDNLNLGIAANGGTYAHMLSYTPTVAGNTIVTVAAVLRFADGSEHTYTYDITYIVRDIDKLIFAGIDGSHHNTYVNGNYKDSMGNFSALAAEYDVRVEILNSSTALIAAAGNPKYQMLILTAPDRHTSVVNKQYYSPEEIAALSAFARRGGSLIITGLADYTEIAFANSAAGADPQNHMAGQQNQLLAALGATLRVSDDEAHDDVYNRNASNTFALELTGAGGSYHWANPLLKGVVPAQIYSQYSGCTIYAVEQSDKDLWNAQPTPALPASVLPVISTSANGRATDEDGDLASGKLNMTIPKYDNKYLIMATETLEHANGKNSQLVVAGGAFMSNFEVKVDIDNAASLQFSNYNICMNLLENIAFAPEITNIADAKSLATGTEVTIEGIATTNVYSADSLTNTGFFDCIYIQDNTGGINLFPVAAGVVEGQKIQVTGILSSYQGETQIAVSRLRVVDEGINKLIPQNVTVEAALDSDNTGLLVELSGTVSDIIKIGDSVSQFSVYDSYGIGALVYINAYITTAVDLSFIKEGAQVKVIGLASIGENQSSSNPLPRIRVRDRNEIKPVNLPNGLDYYVYMQPDKTEVKAGDSILVNIMLDGSKNYTMLTADIAYDINMLEYIGYTYLCGWVASVAKTPANVISVRSMPSANMVAGVSCQGGIIIATLEFKVKDAFTEDKRTAALNFNLAAVNPAGNVKGVITCLGDPLYLYYLVSFSKN